ncbi:hypothetical protein [Mesorhizobium sp. NBSH29]|uniref:hypothetical protein n=1 Tax=Mesorhizobium sp. NBSH29 TaxID=2654249 RepID=UPI0018964090|nr:hypothetical protein [Mesorhizobium sp. NBSH29]
MENGVEAAGATGPITVANHHGQTHPKQRGQKADDGEAACEHWFSPLDAMGGQCLPGAEQVLRSPFILHSKRLT